MATSSDPDGKSCEYLLLTQKRWRSLDGTRLEGVPREDLYFVDEIKKRLPYVLVVMLDEDAPRADMPPALINHLNTTRCLSVCTVLYCLILTHLILCAPAE